MCYVLCENEDMSGNLITTFNLGVKKRHFPPLVLCLFFRPLAPASVIPVVTAFLNHLLCEIESDKLGKGLSFLVFFFNVHSGKMSEELTEKWSNSYNLHRLKLVFNSLIIVKYKIGKIQTPFSE